MSYANPRYPVTYTFAGVDFGAGTKTFQLKPPPGVESGRLDLIHAAVTTTFNAVTTQGYVRVGITGDLDKYAEVPMGTTAANTSVANTRAQVGESRIRVEDGTVLLTCVAPTGGTPAGVGTVTVLIQWF